MTRPSIVYFTTAGYLPEVVGGAQLSTHELLKGVAAAGWDVTVLALGSKATKKHGCVSKRGSRLIEGFSALLEQPDEFSLGGGSYRCLRYNHINYVAKHKIRRKIAKLSPSCLITELGVGGFIKSRVEVINHLRHPRLFVFIKSLPEDDLNIFSEFKGNYQLIANSPYTAREATERLQRPAHHIYPVINIDDVLANGHTGTLISFINIHPLKGARLLPQIARRMPHANFLAVKGGWPDSNPSDLIRELQKLPNVRLCEFTDNMREVYAQTRILLVPSQFEEPFGRVVIEAQANSIPVVASDRGGLRHSVGKGGILISDFQNPAAYAEALNRLLSDSAHFEQIASNALQNSMNIQFSREYQIEKFLEVINT